MSFRQQDRTFRHTPPPPDFHRAGILVVLCFALLKCCLHLDSEVLNLLPGSFDSVKALKTYNRDFSQTRELTFAIYDTTTRPRWRNSRSTSAQC